MSGTYTLRWYGRPVGTFETGEGLSVENFTYEAPFSPDIFPSGENDVPNFLDNLRPQGMMNRIFNETVAYKFRQPVSRFLSNFTVTNNEHKCGDVEVDHHGEKLTVTDDKPFCDYVYFGETPCANEEFVGKIKRYWAQKGMPRYSGYETKLPVNLKKSGLQIASNGNSFSHFLKLPPIEDHRQALCFNEWYCLQLSKAAGLETARNGMIFLAGEEYPSLISERYDIPDDPNSSTWYMTQDGCTLADEDFSEAGNGSYEQLFKTIKSFSTDVDQDREDFFRRMILTVAVQDTDFHKKNISMLIKYDADNQEVVSRRIAPTYDVTSDIYSGERDRALSLTIAGKKSGLNRKALVNFGKNIGLDGDRAEELLDRTMESLVDRAVALAEHPEIPNDDCQYVARRISTLVIQTARKFGVETPAWEDQPIDKDRVAGLRAIAKRDQMTFDYM
jgi:hypothetical protein